LERRITAEDAEVRRGERKKKRVGGSPWVRIEPESRFSFLFFFPFFPLLPFLSYLGGSAVIFFFAVSFASSRLRGELFSGRLRL